MAWVSIPATPDPLSRNAFDRSIHRMIKGSQSPYIGTEVFLRSMSLESTKCKIVLLGDGAVGKTSLVRRFVVDQFDDRYIATIGAKVMKKDVRVSASGEDRDVSLIIWDVLGQEGYRGVQDAAFEQARGVVLVLDLTRPKTSDSVRSYWVPRVREATGSIPMILFANKADLIEYKPTAEHMVDELAAELGCQHFMTSAKTGRNVEEGFSSFARTILEAGAAAKGVSRDSCAQVVDVASVTDRIMVDFCKDFGGVEAGTPILNEQFRRAGFDINRPTKEGLLKVVDLLAIVEISFKSEGEVEKSRARRVGWVESLKDT